MFTSFSDIAAPNREEPVSTARIYRRLATARARQRLPRWRRQCWHINECRVTALLLADGANLFQTIDQVLYLRGTYKPASPDSCLCWTTARRFPSRRTAIEGAFIAAQRFCIRLLHIKEEAVVFHHKLHPFSSAGGHRQHISMFRLGVR